MTTYFETNRKEECYGCKACEQICPKKSIKMKCDREGFWYPKINMDTCVKCNLCRKVCPYNEKSFKINTLNKSLAFATINKNEIVRESSTSGGMFSNISDYILENNGIIFGVELDDNGVVKHSIAVNKKERDKFKGSKYVQSDIQKSYIKAKEYLNSDKLVLFTGTPCQIAGLYSYLGKDYDNLITCDIVCHGVPSPKVFNDYYNFMKKKYRSNISTLNFRDKSNGWKTGTLKIKFNTGKEYSEVWNNDKYYRLFFSHRILRASCHECRFTKLHRESDITIGDFWGIENCKPNMFDNKGTSLVLINTKKGISLFENIKEEIIFEECRLEDVMQPNLKRPAMPSVDREKFFNDYEKKGFKYVIKVYTAVSLKERIIGKIIKLIYN